jgi:hypothetical protein
VVAPTSPVLSTAQGMRRRDEGVNLKGQVVNMPEMEVLTTNYRSGRMQIAETALTQPQTHVSVCVLFSVPLHLSNRP